MGAAMTTKRAKAKTGKETPGKATNCAECERRVIFLVGRMISGEIPRSEPRIVAGVAHAFIGKSKLCSSRMYMGAIQSQLDRAMWIKS